MKSVCKHIQISGIASAVPTTTEDNVKFVEEFGGRRDKKQIKLTGIKERRICQKGQTASDLGTLAAQKLIESLGWKREEINVLILVTQSSDIHRPATAFLIQERLGLSQECMIFDINHGCAGYVIGLSTIASILTTMRGKGLLIVGESTARKSDLAYPNTMLDGAAGSATALEYKEAARDLVFMHHGDGARANLLYTRNDGYSYMDGSAIMLFSLNEVAKSVKSFMKEEGLSDEDVDYYVFHQAQKMIVEGIASVAGIPRNKVLLSCEKYGNTSSASIPLTICNSLGEDKVKGEKKILICGFGIGLAWSVGYMTVKGETIFEVLESDYVYPDKEKLGVKGKQ